MPSLKFDLLPASVGYLHDLLTCLSRFDENVSLEATAENLRISSLNISKTAHASFVLDRSFFSSYYCSVDTRRASTGNKPQSWACNIQNKALLSIFKRRLVDNRDKDTALERCEVELQAKSDQVDCRLLIRLICKFGVVKTYRLYYEQVEPLRASFDKDGSANVWAVSSRTLRDVVEYFGPKTDQLDWFFEDSKMTFTSYTEKIQNGREILKQPIHTSVTVEKKDFDSFNVEEGLHIGIIVKDFRAIVAHAETLKCNVTARYSRGNRPMQISYHSNGMVIEFTLMTRGTSSNIPTGSTASAPARGLSVRPMTQTRLPQPSEPAPEGDQASPKMLPPAAKNSFRESRPEPALDKSNSRESPPAPSASLNPDSLFIPAEDDQQWDEPNYDEEPDIVTWGNASEYASAASSARRIRDSEPQSFVSISASRGKDSYEIAPTQRLSQVKGLFD